LRQRRRAHLGLIDGEAVLSHALLTKRGGVQATLVPFDLLRLDGDDTRASDRSAAMPAPAARRRRQGVFSEALAAEGAIVFAKACELGLFTRAGVPSKRLD